MPSTIGNEHVCVTVDVRQPTSIRIEVVAEPLLAYVRAHLLDQRRIEQAVEAVNRKIEERNRASEPPARLGTLRAEVAQLEREIGNLVDARARGTAYDAIRRTLETKDRRLTAARTEIEALTRSTVPVEAISRVSAEDVRSRLMALSEDVRKLDGDRARVALGRIFQRITVKPLGGSWEAGWTLEMRTRPQVGMPEGAVVQLVGCGGADSNVGAPEVFHLRLRHVRLWRGPRGRKAA